MYSNRESGFALLSLSAIISGLMLTSLAMVNAATESSSKYIFKKMSDSTNAQLVWDKTKKRALYLKAEGSRLSSTVASLSPYNTTIKLINASKFPSHGVVLLGKVGEPNFEIFEYDGKWGDQLTSSIDSIDYPHESGTVVAANTIHSKCDTSGSIIESPQEGVSYTCRDDSAGAQDEDTHYTLIVGSEIVIAGKSFGSQLMIKIRRF